MIDLIEATIERVQPMNPNTTISQLLYFFQAGIDSLNSALYRSGGNIKAITPAPSEPAISRKVVKSGMIRATPVTNRITKLRMMTFFNFK